MRTEEEIKKFLLEREVAWLEYPDIEVDYLILKLTRREIHILYTVAMMKTLEWVLGKEKEDMIWEIDNT